MISSVYRRLTTRIMSPNPSLCKRGEASLAELMDHESVETTKSFYAVFEQDDLRRKHDHFSAESIFRVVKLH